MDNRSTARTIGLATGTVVLLIVLFLVAGISTGFLPWRDSYADGPGVSPEVDVLAPAPTAVIGDAQQMTPAPTTTPTPTPESTPEPDAEPTPTPTPVPTPTTKPDGTLDEELPTYTVTVTFSRGGTAIPYGNNTVVENGEITVVAVPNEGYAVDEMIIDGERYKNVSTYVFEDVTADHTVHISFKRVLFDPDRPYEEEGAPPIQ